MTTLFDLTPEAPAATTATGPRPRLYRVAGIDVSLTGTGVATLGGTTLITSTGRRKDSIAQRRTRIKGIADQVLIEIGTVDLAVIEGPSHHSVGGSVWDRAGLWWRIVVKKKAYQIGGSARTLAWAKVEITPSTLIAANTALLSRSNSAITCAPCLCRVTRATASRVFLNR